MYCVLVLYQYKYVVQMVHTVNANLSAVNRKVVAGFENGFFYRASITYWLLQYLGRILI